MLHTRTLPAPVAIGPPPINLRIASKQEVFDHVAHHLLSQGKPAGSKMAGGGFTCEYRTADGLTCAIGCCISASNYDPRMEGNNVSALAARFPHLGIPPNHMMLLLDLQEAHDDWAHDCRNADCSGIELLREKLCAVARANYLSQEVALTTHPYKYHRHKGQEGNG
jgi:hypothetical protein